MLPVIAIYVFGFIVMLTLTARLPRAHSLYGYYDDPNPMGKATYALFAGALWPISVPLWGFCVLMTLVVRAVRPFTTDD